MGPTERGAGVSVLEECLKRKTLKWNALPTATNKVAKFQGFSKLETCHGNRLKCTGINGNEQEYTGICKIAGYPLTQNIHIEHQNIIKQPGLMQFQLDFYTHTHTHTVGLCYD